MNLFGFGMSQNSYAPELFGGLLNHVAPTVIVELGTGPGGLTSFLGLWALAFSSHVISWDIKECDSRIKRVLERLGVECRNADYNLESEVAYLSSIIQQNNRCLFLCDGGNKQAEMLRFAPMLRSGDVIMAHDYAPDSEAYRLRYSNFWTCQEIDDNIAGQLEPFGFKLFAPEMTAACWICFKKT